MEKGAQISMTSGNHHFLGTLLEFLRGLTPSAEAQLSETGGELDPDTDLIRTGIVDSLSIMQLIVFLEEETGAQVPLEDLMLDSIRTARRIDAVYGPNTPAAG